MAEFPAPTPQDLDYLRANPALAEKFDENFGPGTSQRILGVPGEEEQQAAPTATQATQPAPPEAAPEAAPEGSDDESLIGGIARGIASGAEEAFGELMQAGKSLDNTIGSALEGAGIPSVLQINDPRTGEFDPDFITQSEAEARGGDDAFFGGKEGDTSQAMEIDLVNRPVSTAGKITEGITQFLAGFAVTKKVTGLNGVIGSIAAGGVTDAVFFDPYDGNLQNFLEANDWAIPGVTEALSVDPEDPEWEARLKNSMDGLATGLVVDGFVKGIKAVALRLKADKVGGAAGEALAEEAGALALEASEQAQKHLEEGIEVAADEAGQAAARGAVNAEIREASEVASEIANGGSSQAAGSYVDTDRLRAAVEAAPGVTPDQLAQSNWFNFQKMDGPVEAQKLMETMGTALEESGALKEFGLDAPETLKATRAKAEREVASMLDIGVGRFSGQLERMAVGSVDQAKMVVTGKMVLQTLGREITNLATQVDNRSKAGKGSEELERKLIELMEVHANTQAHLKGIQTAAARATSAGRIRTEDALDDAALAKLQDAGGTTRIRKLATLLRAASGPNQVARIVRRANKPGAMDVINEYWINSLLSGYKTHMVNMTSNAINVALLPAERIAGGMFQGVRGQGFGQMREGFYQYQALRGSLMDSIRLASRSFVQEDTILDAAQKVDLTQGPRKAIAAETFGLRPDTVGGGLVSTMGKFMRLPSRFLMSEDEFFKQIVFRSRLQAQLMEASRTADFAKLGYANRGEFVQGEFEKAFTRAGDLEVEWQRLIDLGKVTDDAALKEQFFKENLGSFKAGNKYAEDALRNARAATFTTPLRPESISGGYQRFANRHPILRQITPFIQTPVNILSTAFERSPGVGISVGLDSLGVIRSNFREQLRSPDPAVRAEAQGKIATGVALTTAATMLAYEGMITGGGPNDPSVRNVWRNDPNWQPYSINIGTAENPEWVAFDRMDPHGFLFGIAADIVEMTQAAEMDPSFDQGTLFAMAAAAVANNVTSKTWLQGVSEFVEILSAKDRPWVVDAWARNKVASFTPFSSLGRQGNQALEPHMVEARGYIDKMMANVPGMTDSLPTRYSWLTGKAVDNPSHLLGYIRMKSEDGDTVGQELRRLNYGFGGPDRKLGEVSLSSEQFQDWNRLMGSVRIGGRTLKERLQRTIESDRYDLNREKVPDGIGDPSESHRVRLIAEVISRYKDKAKRELLEEHPDLADAYFAYRKFKKRAERGKAQPGERENLLLDF